jgi:predicted alpha/beta superfamily hydrolase
MKRFALLLLLLLLAVSVLPAHMQDAEPAPFVVPDAYTFNVTSAITGKDYRISVALPASYESSDQSYPVIYVLDPLTAFLTTTELTRFIRWANEMPDVIVVGVGYPTDDMTETMNPREQDYHFRKDEFIEFFETELFPQVESVYRIDPTDRALIGFSYGGEFVFHVVANRADLFSRYIAIDASDAAQLVTLLMKNDEDFRNQFVGRDVRLFAAAAGTEYIVPALQAKAYEGLTSIGLSLGDVTHAQTLLLGLPAGLIAIYAD